MEPINQEENLLFIRVSDIDPDPGNLRNTGSVEDRADLRASIKTNGVIQPILVRMNKDGRYRLIAGERRWRASSELGLERIPAIVKDIDDIEAVSLQIIENTHRKNLSLYEMFEQYQRLKRLIPKATNPQLAEKLGIDVNNLRRLNALMRDDNRALLLEGMLPDEGGISLVDRFDTLPAIIKRNLIAFKRKVKSVITSKDLDVFKADHSKYCAGVILERFPDMEYLSLISDIALITNRAETTCSKLSRMPKKTCLNKIWNSVSDRIKDDKSLDKENYLGKILMVCDAIGQDLISQENNVILSKAQAGVDADNQSFDWGDDIDDDQPLSFFGDGVELPLPAIETQRESLAEEAGYIQTPQTHYNIETIGQNLAPENQFIRNASGISLLKNSKDNPVFAMGNEPSLMDKVVIDDDTFEVANTIGWKIKWKGSDYLIKIEKI